MVNVICGKKGTGKTKIMLDSANEICKHDKGVVVFIDPTESHMYDLDKKVRYVNLVEYKIDSAKTLLAFIKGGISQNYDIDVIFIDSLYKINSEDEKANTEFFKEIDQMSAKYNIDFHISISADKNDPPSYLTRYI